LKTLIISSWQVPAVEGLAKAAAEAGWVVKDWDKRPRRAPRGDVLYYGGVGLVEEAVATYRFALLEPPLDLLAYIGPDLRKRQVGFGAFGAVGDQKRPTFLKPASPIRKVFDAGVYRSLTQIIERYDVPAETLVLYSEVVEWLVEYRCWILEGEVVATSPYISFGRVGWTPWSATSPVEPPPTEVIDFCGTLADEDGLPPAFVVDVGFIEGRGWAVVEFNPVWCSSVLGSDPQGVLRALERSCCRTDRLAPTDKPWVGHSLAPYRGELRSVTGTRWAPSTPSGLALTA
jgi:hypothetical protein